MNLAVPQNTDLTSFIASLNQGLLSAIYSHSVSAIVVYDLQQKQYLYFSENCKEVLGEHIHHKMFCENEYLLNLVSKPYVKKVQDLLDWKDFSVHRKSELRFSINLPIQSANQAKILLTRYFYLPQKEDVVLFFITDLTKETLFNNLIFTVEKQQINGEYSLLFKNSISASSTQQQLSPRETEILTLIQSGLGTKEIAGKLGISAHTVSTIRKNIKKKNKQSETD